MDCIDWPGRMHTGRPVTRHAGKRIAVRAIVWAKEHGYIPNGKLTTTCGNKRCINPAHLQPYNLELRDIV